MFIIGIFKDIEIPMLWYWVRNGRIESLYRVCYKFCKDLYVHGCVHMCVEKKLLEIY